MAIKGILYDNDGTLVDTYDLILNSMRHCTRTVLGKVIPDEELMAKVGQPLVEQMKDFSDDPDVQAELLRVYRALNESEHDKTVRAFDGAERALARLRDAGLAQGVVTSKMHALAWHGLEITGLAPYLGCCIGANDCEWFKPDPRPVTAGVDALGLDPAQCLYVGDSPFDIHAGNGAGCTTVAVLWGMFPRDELAAENPDHYVGTFDELVDLVLGL